MFNYGAIIALSVSVFLALALQFPNMAPQWPPNPTGHSYGPDSRPSVHWRSNTIHWYSAGRRRPDPDNPDKISKVFDVLVYLLPDYRKLYKPPDGKHSIHILGYFAAGLPNHVREVIAEGGAVDTIDLSDEL
jgi:hypothetical protein